MTTVVKLVNYPLKFKTRGILSGLLAIDGSVESFRGANGSHDSGRKRLSLEAFACLNQHCLVLAWSEFVQANPKIRCGIEQIRRAQRPKFDHFWPKGSDVTSDHLLISTVQAEFDESHVLLEPPEGSFLEFCRHLHIQCSNPRECDLRGSPNTVRLRRSSKSRQIIDRTLEAVEDLRNPRSGIVHYSLQRTLLPYSCQSLRFPSSGARSRACAIRHLR